MPDSLPAPITAASLRDRDEWVLYPGATAVWVQEADEGRGIGFDGLDPSAMVRGYFRTPATWPEVFAWYAERLAGLGWESRSVREDWWWEWDAPSRPGERFLLMDRTRVPEAWQRWAPPVEVLLFEVSLTARGTDTVGSDA